MQVQVYHISLNIEARHPVGIYLGPVYIQGWHLFSLHLPTISLDVVDAAPGLISRSNSFHKSLYSVLARASLR